MAEPRTWFHVGALEDGQFIAASVSTPVFCFIADDEAEVIAKAKRAVRFFHSEAGETFSVPKSRTKQVVHFVPQRRVEVEFEAA